MTRFIALTLTTVLAAGAAAPVALAAEDVTPDEVWIRQTSSWDPPSPDPMGIEYRPSTGTFLVVDSEVEETGLWAGANVWEVSPAGNPIRTATTTAFSLEPTDVALNPANGHLFFPQDNEPRRIFEVTVGPDGLIGTGDDTRRSFGTAAFGSHDPEGLAFGAGSLFIADDAGREIYWLRPGANGRFDGAGSDDVITHFDTAGIGQNIPEGIEYNPDNNTLYICSHGNRNIAEVTLGGTLVRTIDLSDSGLKNCSGLAYAPTSTNSAWRSLYVSDRGVDNDSSPSENDGQLIQVTFGSSLPPPPPQTFRDVPTSYWAWGAVETLVGAGVTGGCSTSPPLFCPERSTTRAEMAVFLVRAMGEDDSLPPYQGTFGDVPRGRWYTPYVERLYQLGVTSGCGGGRYCPGDPVTREQMAAFLLNAMGHAGDAPAFRGLFADVPSTSRFARPIEHLYDHGVTSGCATGPLRYCPRSLVTRAQMAVFLVKAFGL